MKKSERKEIAKVCEYCEHAKTICDDEYMLCELKGPVAYGNSCKKFSYDPLKRAPIPPRAFEIPTKEELEI